MQLFYFSCFTVGIIVGYLILLKKYNEPINFQFAIPTWVKVACGTLMLILLLSAIAVEYAINYIQLDYLSNSANMFAQIVSACIDAGFLQLIFIPLFSRGLGKLIRAFDLDISACYKVTVIKIWCSSMIVLVWGAIWGLYCLGVFYADCDWKSLFMRTLLWVYGVISTWLGIGYDCEGRLESPNKLDVLEKRDYVSYWWIFYVVPAILLLLSLGIYCMEQKHYIVKVMYYVFIHLLFGAVATIFLFSRKYNPDRKRSDKLLRKNIKKFNAGSYSVRGHYQMLEYIISQDEEKVKVRILETPAVGQNIDEIKEKLAYKEEIIEKAEFEICKKKLDENLEERKMFITEEFEKCKEEAIEKIKQKQSNYIE